MEIENSILSATQLDLLSVPEGKSYAITTILVCNYASSGSASFDLHIVKNGEARGDKNVVVSNLELPAGETFTFDSEKIVLEEFDYISFAASPDTGSGDTDLAATVSYLEV